MTTLTEPQIRLLKAAFAEMGGAEFTAASLLLRCAGTQHASGILELRAAIVAVCGHKHSKKKLGHRLRKFVDIRHENLMLESDLDRESHKWVYRVAEYGAPVDPAVQKFVESILSQGERNEEFDARVDRAETLSRAMDRVEAEGRRRDRILNNITKAQELGKANEARREVRAQDREDARRRAAEAKAVDEALGPELTVSLNKLFVEFERAEAYLKLPYAKWIPGERSQVAFNLGRGLVEQKRRYRELMADFAPIRGPGDKIEPIPPEVLIDNLKPYASRDPKDYVDHSSRQAFLLLSTGDTSTPLDSNRRGFGTSWSPFD